METSRISVWQIRVDTPEGYQWLGGVYTIMKLDHLLCVPGLIFLYLGLSRLAARQRPAENGNTGAP